MMELQRRLSNLPFIFFTVCVRVCVCVCVNVHDGITEKAVESAIYFFYCVCAFLLKFYKFCSHLHVSAPPYLSGSRIHGCHSCFLHLYFTVDLPSPLFNVASGLPCGRTSHCTVSRAAGKTISKEAQC